MTLAWVFEDEKTPTSHEVMQQVTESGATVPSLWRLEVASALGAAVRRKRCDEAFVDRTLRRLGDLAITLDDQTDARAWTETLELSRAEALTPYDAAYLELAMRLGVTLATCDAELIAAARRRGLDVLTA